VESTLRKMEAEYQRAVQAVGSLPALVREALTWESYQWAFSVLDSRSFLLPALGAGSDASQEVAKGELRRSPKWGPRGPPSSPSLDLLHHD